MIWIRPVVKTTYTSNMNIAIVTRDLAIRNPTNVNNVQYNWFTVKFYSYENITEPSFSPISNNVHCFLIIDNLPSTAITYSNNPSSVSANTFNFLKIPHQRYYK